MGSIRQTVARPGWLRSQQTKQDHSVLSRTSKADLKQRFGYNGEQDIILLTKNLQDGVDPSCLLVSLVWCHA